VNAKNFTLTLLIAVVFYALYHFAIYTLYTSKIFAREDGKYIGDIARVSYQTDALFPRKLQYTLPKRHLKKSDYNDTLLIDVLTTGDSFSNAATGGKNPYYQDYIATYYNKNVLNIIDTNGGEINLVKPIIALAKSGWIKKHHISFVIIESVERFCIARFAKKFDFTTKNKIDIQKLIRSARTQDSFIPHINFISSANYKFVYYNYMVKKRTHFHPDVILLNLNKELFSPKKFQSKLLIHHEDILSLSYNTKKNIHLLNKNLNTLAQLLKREGAKLIFMPTVDKYDLYYPYIKDNPYKKNNFFDYLREEKKSYILVDTKAILSLLLQNGQKDIYYPDDTHWSTKAIEAIIVSKTFQKVFSCK
jgi:hypothetical protein